MRISGPRAGGVARGVLATLCSLLFLGALLTTTSSPARAAEPDTQSLATWNMQAGSDRWAGAATLATWQSVVALQEVPLQAPAGALPIPSTDGVEHYRWTVSRDEVRYLYILRTGTRDLGMITSWEADNALVLPGVYRPALALVNEEDDTVYASVHAASGGGNDAGSLIRLVADAAYDNVNSNWVVMGDFNRDPAALAALNPPGGTLIYNSGQATQQSGGELDYMVSNVRTDNWQATVGGNRGSDHWPVHFNSLRAAGAPAELTIHPDNADNRVLDVYNEETANGTHVVTYSPTGGANQRWQLIPVDYNSSRGRVVYHIASVSSGRCLDVNNGQSSKAGDWLGVWDCQNGPAGSHHDTGDFTLEHPVANQPNLTMLRDNTTGLIANIYENQTGDGAWVIQWPAPINPGPPPANETFYLHPAVA
ncbi:RICIN domain-containing protein [Streptomyces sp. NPDC007088]|uniref:RICIN domain-containing protein n=1 Tax=Streptomyces sp. NPDC007088 TaxID=3364773 RepID=UPI0036C762BF